MGFQNVWIRFTLPINLKLCTESLPWSAQNLKMMRRLIKSYWERDFARYEFQHHALWRDNIQLSGPRLNIKKSSYQYRDSHHKIRRSQDRLFYIGNPVPEQTAFILRRGPDSWTWIHIDYMNGDAPFTCLLSFTQDDNSPVAAIGQMVDISETIH